MKDFFRGTTWNEILLLGDEMEELVLKVFSQVLERCADVLTHVEQNWQDTPMQPIADALKQVASVCKCFLHLLTWQAPKHLETTSADVFHIFQFKGKDPFERHYKSILSDASDTAATKFWSKQVSDVARTAGSRPLIQGMVTELQELLAAGLENPESIGGTKLSRTAELYVSVQAGLRERELKEISSTCCKVVMNVAKRMMSSKLEDIDQASNAMNATVNLLGKFGNVEQAPTVLDDFKRWVEENETRRQTIDLVDILKGAMRGSIDFQAVKKLIPSKVEVTLDDQRKTFFPAACNFIEKAFMQISDQVGWAVLLWSSRVE